MRQVTAHLFHSLDGVVSSPNLWQFDAFDDDLGQLMMSTLATTDAVILGRTTYEEWAGYWPDAQDPFAQFINPVPKHVASTTLKGPLEWSNSTLIEGDLLDFVRALKETDGQDIAVNGSISVVRQLFLGGLMDRLTLTTHPVVAGAGKHLFKPTDDTTRLALVDHQITSKGNAVLTYALKA
jgi:dihydrofolate reductase